MPETTDKTVAVTPKKSLKTRVLTKKNAKSAAIIGGVLLVALWVKSKVNSSASGSVDLHVETAETDN